MASSIDLELRELDLELTCTDPTLRKRIIKNIWLKMK